MYDSTTDSEKKDNRDFYSTSMKHFNQIFTQRRIFWIFSGIMLVPNIFLCFTEQLPLLFKVSYILIPGALYLLLLILSRKPGITFWALFPLHFIGAFQLVLLYLFGNSIIASDMFLNMFTTNSGEAFELLDKLAPAVVGVFLLYLPALALAVYSIRRTETLTPLFQKRVFMLAMLMIGSGILVYTPAHRKYPHMARLSTFTPSTRSTMPDSPWTVGKQQRTIHAHRENSTTGPHRQETPNSPKSISS